ncbi:TetR/AcrR family transcriptional regulator [Actinobacteria bacterium YIM 96077]|uniref:TetR family transcriptional regulator n=1 Tax=Phytoactinopolyspora halophila TaxID=1981511 RepID=A0A329QVP2_9ACTN|nr:TetR/AcrR family transcriptional regulator [Phytoactinopolyspora halophila]AYY15392.1 TetR/AcrR family transcriptional regulator [Actinobacteria bacterium YIM 96077]RAW16494.1 TetR family transcriptional regulator [Phytoactinopolyspora halophila]
MGSNDHEESGAAGSEIDRAARADGRSTARRRLRKEERREQILRAATRAFARSGGFAHTGLEDVAAAAGVTRMILYRHFDSKTELYHCVIDRAVTRLHEATTTAGALGEGSVPGMIEWARAEPDAFRLIFRHAASDPESSTEIEELRAGMVATLRPYLAEDVTDERWAGWAARVATSIVIESIMAWLDAGEPDPDVAGARILTVVDGVYRAIDSA